MAKVFPTLTASTVKQRRRHIDGVICQAGQPAGARDHRRRGVAIESYRYQDRQRVNFGVVVVGNLPSMGWPGMR